MAPLSAKELDTTVLGHFGWSLQSQMPGPCDGIGNTLPTATTHGHIPFVLRRHQLLLLVHLYFVYRLAATFFVAQATPGIYVNRSVLLVDQFQAESKGPWRTCKMAEGRVESALDQISLLDMKYRAPLLSVNRGVRSLVCCCRLVFGIP